MRGKRAGKIWNWTVASKDVIIECANWAKRVGKLFKLNCSERSERKFFGKFCTFHPNSSKLRSDDLFSFHERTNYLFPAFSRSEYLFPKSASPPHQNQMVFPLSFWKWIPPPPSESNGLPLKSLKMNILVQVSFQIMPQTTWWKEA